MKYKVIRRIASPVQCCFHCSYSPSCSYYQAIVFITHSPIIPYLVKPPSIELREFSGPISVGVKIVCSRFTIKAQILPISHKCINNLISLISSAIMWPQVNASFCIKAKVDFKKPSLKPISYHSLIFIFSLTSYCVSENLLYGLL